MSVKGDGSSLLEPALWVSKSGKRFFAVDKPRTVSPKLAAPPILITCLDGYHRFW